MALSFRTARKLWMGVIALLSLICIILAVVLWAHGYGKSNNFGALVAIPCFAFAGAIWTIFKKRFFSPQIVCMEATWAFVLLPFQISLGLFAFESDGALHTRFTVVYEVLVALVWTNAALGISLFTNPLIPKLNEYPQVFVYAAGIIFLASLTQLSCDQEVWARDIDSSPCPFPFPVLLVYAFPSVAKYVRISAVQTREDPLVAATNYCLPGCSCHPKLNEAPGSESQSANDIEGTRSTIPIRIPTVMDRRNAIRVTLGQMAR